MTKQLDQLLQKEVTRKEFIALSGFGLASIFGFGEIIKLLTGKSTSTQIKSQLGYGSSPYGGSKRA